MAHHLFYFANSIIFSIQHSGGAGGSRNSDVSISVETALGAFDFLESEDYLDSTPNRYLLFY